MAMHVVVGSGPVGSAVARLLLERGEQVRVVTRSGTGPEGAERVRADAADAPRMIALTQGATALYNCVNPPYDRWAADWPPVAAGLLGAAESSGAVRATTSNLYVYGPVDGPMTEDLHLVALGTKGRVRAQMWRDALGAHEAGRVRAFEVRGSDYIGAPGSSLVSMLMLPAWRKGRTAWLAANLDVPHSWTDVEDVATLLVAGVQDARAWGRPWHVPTAAPRTMRELAALAGKRAQTPAGVRSLPQAAVWAAGVADPFVRELREAQHQFRRPFVLDSSPAQQTFGLEPTATEVAVGREVDEFARTHAEAAGALH
ncbi:NAD-dependent epimerase/dehydratase family protein [soil metagenome]